MNAPRFSNCHRFVLHCYVKTKQNHDILYHSMKPMNLSFSVQIKQLGSFHASTLAKHIQLIHCDLNDMYLDKQQKCTKKKNIPELITYIFSMTQRFLTSFLKVVESSLICLFRSRLNDYSNESCKNSSIMFTMLLAFQVFKRKMLNITQVGKFYSQ